MKNLLQKAIEKYAEENERYRQALIDCPSWYDLHIAPDYDYNVKLDERKTELRSELKKFISTAHQTYYKHNAKKISNPAEKLLTILDGDCEVSDEEIKIALEQTLINAHEMIDKDRNFTKLEALKFSCLAILDIPALLVDTSLMLLVVALATPFIVFTYPHAYAFLSNYNGLNSLIGDRMDSMFKKNGYKEADYVAIYDTYLRAFQSDYETITKKDLVKYSKVNHFISKEYERELRREGYRQNLVENYELYNTLFDASLEQNTPDEFRKKFDKLIKPKDLGLSEDKYREIITEKALNSIHSIHTSSLAEKTV